MVMLLPKAFVPKVVDSCYNSTTLKLSAFNPLHLLLSVSQSEISHFAFKEPGLDK